MSARAVVNPLDVVALHSRGLTYREAGEILGVSPNAVYKHAHDMGLVFAKGQHPNRTPDDLRERVLELREKGWTAEEIGRKVGRSKSWVAKFLRGER